MGFQCKADLRNSTLPRDSTAKIEMPMYTNEETEENYQDLFECVTLCLAEATGASKEAARARIVLLAKDYNPAIEAARLSHLPGARPMGDPTHMWKQLKSKVPKNCHESGAADPTSASQKTNAAQIIDGLEAILLHAHTIDLAECLLSTFTEQAGVVLGEKAAAEYISHPVYMQDVDAQKLTEWGIQPVSRSKAAFRFCSAWQGLFSAYPGLQNGSQCIEAFHNKWEHERKLICGSDALPHALATTQRLYRNEHDFRSMWKDREAF